MQIKFQHANNDVSIKQPTSEFEVANKKYVDNAVVICNSDPTTHISAAERLKLSRIAEYATANVGDVTLTETQTLTNKTLESPVLKGVTTFSDEYVVPVTAFNVNIDFANGNKQVMTLNRNVSVFLSAPGIGTYQIVVIQDWTGNRTLTWNGISMFLGSPTAPPVKTNPNSRTLFTLYYDGSEYYLAGSKVGG